MTEKYLNKAKEIGKGFGIKTEQGIWSLANDLRETENHFIKLGFEYVDYALENNLYDKDPYCKARLHLNELEILEKTIDEDFEIVKKDKFFEEIKERITWDNAKEVFDNLVKNKIIKVF